MTYRITEAIRREAAGGSAIPQQLQPNAASQTRNSRQNFADIALKAAAGFWYLVAVIGQLMFASYIVVFYGSSAVQGNFSAWNKVMPRGFVPGDTVGNSVIALHLLFAVYITVGGAIQLVPRIRDRAPSIHRWNGRIYIPTAFVMSIGGLYLVWVRGTVGDLSQHISISLNAVLIMLCAAMTLRYALTYEIEVHRRWALRLFLVVSGVWFFRVGLMFWILINGGPVGFDPKTFQGPALTVIAFGQYLLPLAVLELYLYARDRGGASVRLAMAAGLFVLTVAMGVGIFGAAMGMWMGRIF